VTVTPGTATHDISTTRTPSRSPTGSIQVFADGDGEIQRSSHIIRVSGSLWDVALAKNTSLVAAVVLRTLSLALNIPADQIQIESISVGSLVVRFTVNRNASQAMPDAAIDTYTLESNLTNLSATYVFLTSDANGTSIEVLSVTTVKSSLVASEEPSCGSVCKIGAIAAAVGGMIVAAIVAGCIVWRRRRFLAKAKEVVGNQPMSAPTVIQKVVEALRERREMKKRDTKLAGSQRRVAAASHEPLTDDIPRDNVEAGNGAMVTTSPSEETPTTPFTWRASLLDDVPERRRTAQSPLPLVLDDVKIVALVDHDDDGAEDPANRVFASLLDELAGDEASHDNRAIHVQVADVDHDADPFGVPLSQGQRQQPYSYHTDGPLLEEDRAVGFGMFDDRESESGERTPTSPRISESSSSSSSTDVLSTPPRTSRASIPMVVNASSLPATAPPPPQLQQATVMTLVIPPPPGSQRLHSAIIAPPLDRRANLTVRQPPFGAPLNASSAPLVELLRTSSFGTTTGTTNSSSEEMVAAQQHFARSGSVATTALISPLSLPSTSVLLVAPSSAVASASRHIVPPVSRAPTAQSSTSGADVSPTRQLSFYQLPSAMRSCVNSVVEPHLLEEGRAQGSSVENHHSSSSLNRTSSVPSSSATTEVRPAVTSAESHLSQTNPLVHLFGPDIAAATVPPRHRRVSAVSFSAHSKGGTEAKTSSLSSHPSATPKMSFSLSSPASPPTLYPLDKRQSSSVNPLGESIKSLSSRGESLAADVLAPIAQHGSLNGCQRIDSTSRGSVQWVQLAPQQSDYHWTSSIDGSSDDSHSSESCDDGSSSATSTTTSDLGSSSSRSETRAQSADADQIDDVVFFRTQRTANPEMSLAASVYALMNIAVPQAPSAESRRAPPTALRTNKPSPPHFTPPAPMSVPSGRSTRPSPPTASAQTLSNPLAAMQDGFPDRLHARNVLSQQDTFALVISNEDDQQSTRQSVFGLDDASEASDDHNAPHAIVNILRPLDQHDEVGDDDDDSEYEWVLEAL
jgi:hypothetical protein